MAKTRCLAPTEQWRRCPAQIGVDDVPRTDKAVVCPAPILVDPTVGDVTVEVPSTDNGADEVPRTDTGVEVSCTKRTVDDVTMTSPEELVSHQHQRSSSCYVIDHKFFVTLVGFEFVSTDCATKPLGHYTG